MPGPTRLLDPETSVSTSLRAVSRSFPAGLYAGIIFVLVILGSLSLSPLWLAMWQLWTTDPLRSIGAAFPLVACAGVLVSWRRLGWKMNGASAPLLLVAISILLARILSVVAVGFDGQPLINYGAALFLYATGAVLVFGGPRLLRASFVPLCLLLLINPVPHIFNLLVDLPLQSISASTARSFAHLLGLQPTGRQLLMMFAPDFGMFIAPGCNGVHGSLTLAYLALIFGYARRLRPRVLVLITAAALLLGYGFNLLRLCVLVVYYRIGVALPSIQKHGAAVDYAIGCTLFLFATMGLGLLIRSLEPSVAVEVLKLDPGPDTASTGPRLEDRYPGHAAAGRALCFLTLTSAFIVPNLRSLPLLSAPQPRELEILRSFPPAVGLYRLTHTWAEHDVYGRIVFALADYSTSSSPASVPGRFTLGLWVGSSHHLTAHCKLASGTSPQWTGFFNATAQQAMPVQFVTSFYDDGNGRQYDAESTCSLGGCSANPGAFRRSGFYFTAPGLFRLTTALSGKFSPFTSGHSLPIVLRREWTETEQASPYDLRAQFEADARLFMAQLDMKPLLLQDGSHLEVETSSGLLRTP